MSRFTLIGRNEFPSTVATRVGKTDVAYAYMDETMKTITFFIPLEEDTPERVEKELREAVARATAAGPKIIEI